MDVFPNINLPVHLGTLQERPQTRVPRIWRLMMGTYRSNLLTPSNWFLFSLMKELTMDGKCLSSKPFLSQDYGYGLEEAMMRQVLGIFSLAASSLLLLAVAFFKIHPMSNCQRSRLQELKLDRISSPKTRNRNMSPAND